MDRITREESPRYRAQQVRIEDALAGDHAIFKSGPRRIVRTLRGGGVVLVQIANGRMGGRYPEPHWTPTVADGKRETYYLPSDLSVAGVTRAWRITPKGDA